MKKEFKKVVPCLLFFFMLCVSGYAEDVKISVREDGLYYVTQSDLLNAGLDLGGVDPGYIRILNRGTEIPVFISGAQDGTFDPGDYIEFYAVAVHKVSPNYDFTETNIYWLRTGGAQGLRVENIDGTIIGGVVLQDFPTSLHVEKNTFFSQNIPNGFGVDHWFWDKYINAPSTVNYTVPLNNISTSASEATLRVNLYGRAGDSTLNPDHHTQIYINDCLVAEKNWNGRVASLHEGTVAQACLRDGDNQLKVISPGDTGASADQIFMDWIQIDYRDRFVAENDSLLFSLSQPGTFEINISEFSQGKEVMVYDITSPGNVRRIINNTTQAGVTRFEVVPTRSTEYLALTRDRRKSPPLIEVDTPSSLKSISHQADYIIITHDDFYDNVLPLAAHHSSSGLNVKVVKISDVYDEFNYGIVNPRAIKDFLKFTYDHWLKPAPLYVLLVGDGNMDIKDNFNKGNKSFIPTYYVETPVLGYTPSDNWFVSVSGNDSLPDMFLGRIPARTSGDVDAVVNKITGYADSAGFPWSATVQFVADDKIPEFENLSDEIILNHFSPEYSSKKVYLSESDPASARADIMNNLDNGVLITNYTGHGSTFSWRKQILATEDIPHLNNQDNLTFMVILNCLNGFFTLPVSPWSNNSSSQTTSLGEQLLLEPEKGAIASFAATSAGYLSEHSSLAKALFDAIMKEGKTILGEATTQAKILAASSGASDDLVKTFLLLGDPAVDLKAVQKSGAGTGVDSSAGGGAGNSTSLASGSLSDAAADGEKGGGGCFIGSSQNHSGPALTGNQFLKDVSGTLLLLLACLYMMRRRLFFLSRANRF